MRRRRHKSRSKTQLLYSIFLYITCLLFALFFIVYLFVNNVYVKADKIAEDYMQGITRNTFVHSTPTNIYDYKGNLIRSINLSNFQYTKLDDISNYFKDGYIAVEDRQFYEHNGINTKALTRAFVTLLKNDGEVTQGGSTITQQVLKNNILYTENKLNRKTIELALAPKFEEKFTKDEILEFYLNTNFYQNNCYGVEMASRYYFNKHAKDVTLAEAAGIVGISNNPSLYNPVTHPDNYLEKRTFVLDIMLQEGYITQDEYNTAVEEPLVLALYRDPIFKEDYMTSYALDCATEELMLQNGFQFQYNFDDEASYKDYWTRYNEQYTEFSRKLRAGGYSIYTSFNQDVQKQLQDIVDKELSKFTDTLNDGRYKLQGSATIINNNNNMIIAMVGGRGDNDEYNRAFQTHRQPGSAIKPIVSYAPAFDTYKYYPSLLVSKAKDEWYPNNWANDYDGNIKIREAVARSTNTVAFRLMQEVGVNKCIEYLERMHFAGLSWEDNDNSSISIGGFTNGVSSLEMAKAYNTIANNGLYTNSNCLLKITYNDKDIYNYIETQDRIYQPESSAMIIDCMKDVITQPYGTGGFARLDHQVMAGKTGTTNDNKDGWFCGITPYYTCAVWCGFEYPEAVQDMGGGTYPAHIFRNVMNYLHTNLPNKDFVYQGVMIRNVDYKGNPVSYRTNSQDIFSSTAYEVEQQTKEQERIRQEQEQKDSAVQQINSSIKNIKAMNLSSISDVNRIESIYDNGIYYCNMYGFIELKQSLESAYMYRQQDINAIKKQYQNEQKAIEEKNRQEENKKVEEVKKVIDNYRFGFSTKQEVLSALDSIKDSSEYEVLYDEYEDILSIQEPDIEDYAEKETKTETTTVFNVVEEATMQSETERELTMLDIEMESEKNANN